jgi:hypothetical protein
MPTPFDVVEASIADLRAALDSGPVTAVGLLDASWSASRFTTTPGSG